MRGTLFDAVLFDRDGTLVQDIPHHGNPDLVRPVAGARPDPALPAGAGAVSTRVETLTAAQTQSGLDRFLGDWGRLPEEEPCGSR